MKIERLQREFDKKLFVIGLDLLPSFICSNYLFLFVCLQDTIHSLKSSWLYIVFLTFFMGG